MHRDALWTNIVGAWFTDPEDEERMEAIRKERGEKEESDSWLVFPEWNTRVGLKNGRVVRTLNPQRPIAQEPELELPPNHIFNPVVSMGVNP